MTVGPGLAPGAVEPLVATHVLEYPYTRSVGPVIGRFFTSLQEGRIEGVRTADGRVIVPPGGIYALTCSAVGTTHIVDAGIIWAEVDWPL